MLSAGSTHHQFQLGYWYGDFFITTKGNPIFRNVPTTNLEWQNIQPQRSLALLKYRYQNISIHKVVFDVDFDAYYDIFHTLFDYSFGIYLKINYNHRFKIKQHE